MQADSLLALLILYIFLLFYENYYIHCHFSFFISSSSWKMFLCILFLYLFPYFLFSVFYCSVFYWYALKHITRHLYPPNFHLFCRTNPQSIYSLFCFGEFCFVFCFFVYFRIKLHLSSSKKVAKICPVENKVESSRINWPGRKSIDTDSFGQGVLHGMSYRSEIVEWDTTKRCFTCWEEILTSKTF